MRNNQPVTQREFEFPDNATLMSTTDTNSYITYANAAFIQVSGFSSDAVKMFASQFATELHVHAAGHCPRLVIFL